MNVPSPNRHLRERGTSLPDPQTGNGKGKRSHTIDLYRLREFTVKNNRIISHTESLQPRYGRSSNSINSSASRYDLVMDGLRTLQCLNPFSYFGLGHLINSRISINSGISRYESSHLQRTIVELRPISPTSLMDP